MSDEIKKEIKNVTDSKAFRRVIYSLGILIIVFFIFQAGMAVGFKEASFGRDWNSNYAMNFGPERGGLPEMIDGKFGDFPNAHGAIGKIIKMELPTVVVLDEKDNTEKLVLINQKTEIRQMRNIINQDQLKIDDHVIIIGAPNSSGQIEARLIRLLPPLPIPFQTN